MTDKAALVELLKQTIATDRYPLSPRIRKPRAILAKLEPAPPRPEPGTSAEANRRAKHGAGEEEAPAPMTDRASDIFRRR